MFQHTATRRWLPKSDYMASLIEEVSTHSHPKVAASIPLKHHFPFLYVSTHSHPKVAAPENGTITGFSTVSTHSHPKVAAGFYIGIIHFLRSFNTQPPEGGCIWYCIIKIVPSCFNTQPPEGGCQNEQFFAPSDNLFQHTATRRWLLDKEPNIENLTSFNTQPPEGGCAFRYKILSH